MGNSDRDIKKNIIYGFGLYKSPRNGKISNICVKICDFNPWMYVEINPSMKNWKHKTNQNEIVNLISSRLYKYRQDIATKPQFVFMKKLYYSNLEKNEDDDEYTEKLFPFVKIECYSNEARRRIAGNLRMNFAVNGFDSYGKIAFKIHEIDASPLLQFVSLQHINIGGWNSIDGKNYKFVENDNKITQYKYEIITSYKNVCGIEKTEWLQPVLLSFDIECYSSIPTSMPNPDRPQDCVFQIGCVIVNEDMKKEKYIFCYSKTGIPPKKFANDVKILNFVSEEQMLIGFTSFIHEKNVNIITGWNIFGFDIEYQYKRIQKYYSHSKDEFLHQGVLLDRSSEYKEISWSSSAARAKYFKFIDTNGRIYIDMMNEVMRNPAFKFDSYALGPVSQEFLGDTKDDVSAKKMFKLFEKGDGQSLSIIAKYCVQDSDLVARIFDKLKTWQQISVMSTVCRTLPIDLGTRGQQLKVFSQIYDYCVNDNRVVEKDAYVVKDGEGYGGAYVFPPTPGLYENVLPFDFASLYPSIIIAFNICFSTLVLDDSIPDDMCHIFEWIEHNGCEHDTTIRKSKKTKKTVICGKFKYRFLKSPIGVLPSKLVSLLNERKEVRKKMKPLEEKLYKVKKGELVLSEKEKFDIETDITVYDAQQLALKVSANSVRANTPIPCKVFGRFEYKTIEEISKGDWIIDSEGNELSSPIDGLEVWSDIGFTKVKYVFRHKLQPNEKLIRVETDNGIVECTKDHSLLYEDGREVKPTDIKLTDKLMHKQIDVFNMYSVEKLLIKDLNKYTILNITDEIKQNKYYNLGKTFISRKYENVEFSNVLNLSYENRYAYLCGVFSNHYKMSHFYFESHNKIIIENWLLKNPKNYNIDNCQTMLFVVMLKSVGLNANVSIKPFRIEISDDDIEYNNCPFSIQYIENNCSNEYVYDIETESHHFAAGVGNMIVHNSAYGAMGVKKGFLPFMPGAMCTTARGRESVHLASKILNEKFGGTIIYGDTDSNYVHFSHLTKPEEIWDYAIQVQSKLKEYFPPPMGMEFENVNYRKFLIFGKKSYIMIPSGRDGVYQSGVKKRGVMSVKRGNCKYARELFDDIVYKTLLAEMPIDDIMYYSIQKVLAFCYRQVNFKDLIITKSLGNFDGYKSKSLNSDPKKREMQLKKKKVTNEEDFKLKSLPGHVQLALKMKQRGEIVDSGSRIAYVVLYSDNLKSEKYERMEDPNYFLKHRSILRLDYEGYVGQLTNPFDDISVVAWKKGKIFTQLYNQMIQKKKVMNQIKIYSERKIVFVDNTKITKYFSTNK